MSWAVLLQWSRLGVATVVFLVASRFLTLAEIGAFATAFAPIRLTQSLFRTGIAEATILAKGRRDYAAIQAWSRVFGVAFCALWLGLGCALMGWSFGSMLAVLACVPLCQGAAAHAEGRLRRAEALRALTLRTVAAQGIAAVCTLVALMAGIGVWSLVGFVLLNASLNAGVTLALAPHATGRVTIADLLRTVRPIVQLAGRDLLMSGKPPLLQLAASGAFGMTAAGAFQIAQRFQALLDALALSPLRYVSLPRFARLVQHPEVFARSLEQGLGLATAIAGVVYLGAFAVAPELLTLGVGPEHAKASTGLLRAFCIMGLIGALSMIPVQALTALGARGLVLRRAALSLGLTGVLAVPALLVSPLALALAACLASAVVLFSLAPALRHLPASPAQQWAAVRAPLAAALAMTAVLMALAPMITLPPLLSFLAKALLGLAIFAALLWRRTPLILRYTP